MPKLLQLAYLSAKVGATGPGTVRAGTALRRGRGKLLPDQRLCHRPQTLSHTNPPGPRGFAKAAKDQGVSVLQKRALLPALQSEGLPRVKELVAHMKAALNPLPPWELATGTVTTP